MTDTTLGDNFIFLYGLMLACLVLLYLLDIVTGLFGIGYARIIIIFIGFIVFTRVTWRLI